MLTAARKDGQLVTDEWQFIQQPIEGVAAREVLHVPRDHGVITETYRPEWDPSGLPAVHVYQSRLYAGAIGAWSCHAKTIDRLFVNQGHLKVVLYDGREESPTYRQLMELHAGDARRGSRSLPPTVGLGRDPLSLGDRRRDPLPQRSRLNAFSAGNSPRRLAYRTDTMSRIPVGLFLLLVNVSAFAAQSPATGKLTPCHVPDVDEEVRCGTHEVYENRIAQKGRKIAIHVVLLPAKGPKVTPDPLVFLAGGGVAPATRYAGYFSRAFPKLRRERDILLVDQRGTGGSNALQCELSTDPTSADYRDEERFVAAVRRCRAGLEQKADLRFYTTPIAMDDLDDVRKWLGYPFLNLYGASYGTSAAMAYVRQHGDHVRTVTLQGVVPLDVPMWLEVPRSSQQALARVFAGCAQQRECHAAFPDLEDEFTSLMKRLSEKSVSVKTKLESGKDGEVMIDAEVLRDVVSRMLYGLERVHDLPLLIHLANQGDYELLTSKAASRGSSEIPRGIYLSIVCSELIPQFNPNALPAASAGTFMGSFRVGREITACGQWVRGWLPPNFHEAVKSDVPALVMNGSLDHLTPPRYGEHVAQSLRNARHVVLPRRGHNDVDPCVNTIIEDFIAAGKSSSLDTSCLAKADPLSFALKRADLAN